MIRTDHLEGREFVHGVSDCFTAVRDCYRDNFRIKLSDYSREDGWWESAKESLYLKYARTEGFFIVDNWQRDLQPGDVPIMAIFESIGSHAGVYLNGNRLFHHFLGRRSTTEQFKGIWRSNTIAVLRHHRVRPEEHLRRVDITELMPDSFKEIIGAAVP